MTGALQPGSRLAGRADTYEIVELLRRGAASEVYLGRRVSDGLAVALKRLSSGAELHGLHKVSGLPGLPVLYDWRANGDELFVVRDYFPEGSLEELLARGPLDAQATWRLLGDLLEALVGLHRHSLLHLDVTPANVLVDGDRFVLADLGGSGLVGSPHLGAAGTPGYRAPEQAWGRPRQIGPRTDLYGVGATVWAACTGRLVGAVDESADWAAFHGLPDLRGRCPDLPELMANTVMALLRAHPERRPGSAAQVLERMRNPPVLHGTLDERLVSAGQAAATLSGVAHPLLRGILRDTPGLRLARFRAGDPLCRAGEASYHAFLLLDGEVRVHRGERELAVLASPGEIIGETAAVSGVTRTADMTALTDTTCAVFNGGELLDFLRRHPECALQLVANLAERLAREAER